MEIVATNSVITKSEAPKPAEPNQISLVTLGLDLEEFHIIRQALGLAETKLQLPAYQSRMLIDMNKTINAHQAFVQSQK